MPQRLNPMKAALSQAPNDTYQQFQDLRDGLIAALVDWPVQKWDVVDNYLPTNAKVSQKSREWLNALVDVLDVNLPRQKAEATPDRLEELLLLASMKSIG
ncbi:MULTISPECIES: hypothetical protein [Pseudomonas]|uniref:Uncharacterized protein n=1 Tax=Pseudomonas asplenii TaxID=53407 RepID=A0A0N0E4V7_9PSED|nr:hypothetical protein [Pseudomonas fuscovaginae]KPA91723.1 hypothetical protein PF66_01746 [Pseudomonas fuscovaginae]KPA96369.1 hypothetical protein PF70_03575 [Pseudomonas fuscovaginae]